jgi:hypothetical protein
MSTKSRNTEEVERLLLGALCTGPLSPEDRSDILRSIADYNWIHLDHSVIYEALRRSCHRELPALREHIVSEITRLGFPDIEVDPFFNPCALTKAEIVGLANALLAAGPDLAHRK